MYKLLELLKVLIINLSVQQLNKLESTELISNHRVHPAIGFII